MTNPKPTGRYAEALDTVADVVRADADAISEIKASGAPLGDVVARMEDQGGLVARLAKALPALREACRIADLAEHMHPNPHVQPGRVIVAWIHPDDIRELEIGSPDVTVDGAMREGYTRTRVEIYIPEKSEC